MFHCTLLTMTSVNLLGSILVCLVASPTSATPLGSTSSPQESYQQYLKSLAVPKLGSTRAPLQTVASYPAGSYESALLAGDFHFLKYLCITVACQYVLIEHIC